MRLLIGGNKLLNVKQQWSRQKTQDSAGQINVFISVSSFTFHACQFFLKETNLFLGLTLVYN